jgi:hypothetical protein
VVLGVVGDLAVGGPGAHQHAGAEDHALGLHLLDAAVDVRLLHLEVGDAVAQQAADAAVLLEHRHAWPARASCCAAARPAGPEPTTATFLPVFAAGGAAHPAFGPGAVDDGVLDALDAHRVVVDVERAGGLAGRRADAAGELGEVVGLVQHLDGVLPVAAVHQVVEVRDDVVDRAAAVAERRAAVHAARALHLACSAFRPMTNSFQFFSRCSTGS